MVSEGRVVVRSGKMVTGTGQKRDFWAQIISHPWSGCPLHKCVHFVTICETEHTVCALFCRAVICQ